jgi:transposase InsO family protein
VTANFGMLYVFVAIEVESRKLLHVNAAAHPTLQWTLQQLREAIPSDHSYRWLVHDRSGIFSNDLDSALETMEVTAVKTPVAAPKANAYCERVIGSLRRECLDWFIPLSEKHLRRAHSRTDGSPQPGTTAPESLSRPSRSSARTASRAAVSKACHSQRDADQEDAGFGRIAS